MTTRVSMVLLLAGVLLAGQALAACGHDEIGRFYDKGIPASRIADRCEMNVDEVADIIAHRRAERADEPEDVYSDEDIPPPRHSGRPTVAMWPAISAVPSCMAIPRPVRHASVRARAME